MVQTDKQQTKFGSFNLNKLLLLDHSQFDEIRVFKSSRAIEIEPLTFPINHESKLHHSVSAQTILNVFQTLSQLPH